MKYINPFLLFDHIGQSNLQDSKSLRQAKKRLIQNFDLTEDGMLNIGEMSLHKSDAMRFLEELDDSVYLAYHLFIYKNTGLCRFLMSLEGQHNLPMIEDVEEGGDGLLRYISPFFSHVYSSKLLEAVKRTDVAQVKSIIEMPLLVVEDDVEACYLPVHAYLNNSVVIELNKVESELDENTYFLRISTLYDNLFQLVKPEILNILPDYFQEQRNRIAGTLREIAISLQKINVSNTLCLDVLKIAANIRADGLVQSRLQIDLATAGSNVVGERQAKQQKVGNGIEPLFGRVGGIIFFLVLIGFIAISIIHDSCSDKQTQTHSKSKKSIEIHSLSDLIDSGKLRLSSKESELAGLADEIRNDESRIKSIKRSLKLIEARSGDLSQSEIDDYEAKVEEHNRIVIRYNSKLVRYEGQYRVYSSLSDSVNAMVSQYNSGRR